MRFRVIFGAILRKFLSQPVLLRLFKTKQFSVFTNLVNFDVLYAILVFFPCGFAVLRFSDPPPAHQAPLLMMAAKRKARKNDIKNVIIKARNTLCKCLIKIRKIKPASLPEWSYQ